jgi:hypothetical protein
VITPDVEAAMRAAVADLERDADTAEANAPGLVSGAWASIIGADSSASAARELARQCRRDADTYRARLVSMLADPKATDAAGLEFVNQSRSTYGNGQAGALVAETAHLLTPTAAAAEVASGTAADLRKWALPASGVVLVVGLAIVVLVLRDRIRVRA